MFYSIRSFRKGGIKTIMPKNSLTCEAFFGIQCYKNSYSFVDLELWTQLKKCLLKLVDGKIVKENILFIIYTLCKIRWNWGRVSL